MTIRPTRAQIEAGLHSMDTRIDPLVSSDLGLTTPDNFFSHVESGASVLAATKGQHTTRTTYDPPQDHNPKHGEGFFTDSNFSRRFAQVFRDARAAQNGSKGE